MFLHSCYYHYKMDLYMVDLTYTDLKSQTAVTAYFLFEQLLLSSHGTMVMRRINHLVPFKIPHV